MARLKKAIDYINFLCASKQRERQLLGEDLRRLYERWRSTLKLGDFLAFVDFIMVNKQLMGAAQFFGKFRAYAFEEYIYTLLINRCRLPHPMGIYWGEKCIVMHDGVKAYGMEFDVSVGVKNAGYVDPALVIDAKVELDSARLKASLGSFAILKRQKPEVKCALVYVLKELDEALLRLAGDWIDAFFNLSEDKDEVEGLINYVGSCVNRD